MIRVLLILVNVFFFWMARLLSGDPSAEITAPETIKSGQSFTVNVRIMVNDAKDFLRFAMTLPEGFKATAGSNDGGKFLFEEQTVKLIWAELKEEEMNISFTVQVPANASGEYAFSAKLVRLVDNLPEELILNPLKVKVGDGSPVAVLPAKVDTTLRPAVQVSVLRTVPNSAVTGEFFVDLSIQKGDLRTFLKLIDTIPPGCNAVMVRGDGSSDFECKDGVVTFRWYSLTERPNLSIRYKVIASPDMEGTFPIKGMVSYVENESGKLIPIPVSEVTFKPSAALAGNDNQRQNGNDDGSKPAFQSNSDATADAQKQQEGGVKTTAVVTSGNNQKKQQDESAPVQTASPEKTVTPAANTAGVSYSVQIAAMQRNVPVSYYAGTYSISEPINREQVDGLNKYTTGKYTSYDAARGGREQLRGKGVQGAFVTAYSSGRRITVQEALMISNQKWVK
ncbi:MAG: hypothetical protein ACK5Z2_01545 [Bacteroidota bacterium]|jgi:hypothetical protein